MFYNPFYNIENPELMGYEYAWVNFVKDDILPKSIIEKEILDSWERCKTKGLDAMARQIPKKVYGYKELEGKIKGNEKLLEIAKPIMDGIVNILEENNIRMVIVDSEKHVLMEIQRANISIDENLLVIGESFDEDFLGTNSFDLSIRHNEPMSVIGAEHYFQQRHRYAEYAAPVLGTDNQIKGAIGIIIEVEEMGHYVLGMVTAAAKAIENELQLAESNAIIFRQNKEKENILDSVTDGVVYVDEQRIITQANLQITKFTGLKKEDLIGKPISIIQTVPPIASVMSMDGENRRDIQVKLKGKDRSYNCFLNHDIIKGRHGTENNIVLIFTTVEEIQELADKINPGHRAFFTFNSIIGKSKLLSDAVALAKKAAEHETRVIIEGESGTGKEMFAQSIHNSSSRRDGPFVAIDCGAIPRELLESEIFGYEEGAYTGARKGGNRGKFELAHKGTLFLDEIANLPLDMQVKLLRVLQENKVIRIGGYRPFDVDVQIIAATNVNLKKEVESGTFREDLFYRLNIVHIVLPPLRERSEDIQTLIENFIYVNRHQINEKIKGIDDEALQILTNYNWPGNVRQLNNVIERMMILCDEKILTQKHIPKDIAQEGDNLISSVFRMDSIDTLEVINRKYVTNVVSECRGNIKKASELLGISRATVYRFLKDEDRI